MKVKELMTNGANWVMPSRSVAEAAATMLRHNIGALPVCENEVLIGIVTDRDIVVRAVAHGADVHKTSVGEVMTPTPTRCYADADIQVVARMMKGRKIRRMPVVDEEERLIGMLSLDDFPRKAAGEDLAAEILRSTGARHVGCAT